MLNIIEEINNNRSGKLIGLPCFCTANELAIRSIFEYSRKRKFPVVIEATCNQVNQDGGYTGMTAAMFSDWIESLATEYGIAPSNILLGGDHLGPNPWRHLSPEDAMAKADVLVRDFAAAGFRKIHLDASMACGDEATPSFELVAQRAARLCKIADQHSPHREDLIYIIGTEVPIPGGEADDMDALSVTNVARLNETIDTHRHAFEQTGISHLWSKIVSVVTQPGVDFSHTAVHRFQPDKAQRLSTGVHPFENMSFEAHSTDYQPADALFELVKKHFFFLKVGPELTFRLREAVFSLAAIEDSLLPKEVQSGIVDALDQAMDENTDHWSPYYRGDVDAVSHLRHFSYSDRIRYYWSVPEVRKALATLFANLARIEIPETLVSQYFSEREFGTLGVSAEQLTADHIALCTGRYYKACGFV